jgi:hypothetical protein
MIFCRDHVSCNDFGDCHDEIAVADIDFIGRRPICGVYLQGRGASGCFQRGYVLRVIDLFVDGRGEEIKV